MKKTGIEKYKIERSMTLRELEERRVKRINRLIHVGMTVFGFAVGWLLADFIMRRI